MLDEKSNAFTVPVPCCRRASCHGVHAGDTALQLACSCPRPDLGLVTALLASGADPLQPRLCDGNTPLLLVVKSGGEAGLELARALLQASGSRSAQQQGRQQQPGLKQGQEEPTSKPMWCSLDATDRDTSSLVSNQLSPAVAAAAGTGVGGGAGVDAANAAGETAARVAAAAVLAALQAPAAAGNGASDPAAAPQQELLALLLGHNARLPPQEAGALLQQGLAGKLSDGLTAKVSCLAAG